MAKMEATDDNKHQQSSAAMKTYTQDQWDGKAVQPFWKTVWQFLTKSNIILPKNLQYYSDGFKILSHKNL